MAVVRRDPAGCFTGLLLIEGTTLCASQQILIDTGGRVARYVECGLRDPVAVENITLGVDRLVPTGIEWMNP